MPERRVAERHASVRSSSSGAGASSRAARPADGMAAKERLRRGATSARATSTAARRTARKSAPERRVERILERAREHTTRVQDRAAPTAAAAATPDSRSASKRAASRASAMRDGAPSASSTHGRASRARPRGPARTDEERVAVAVGPAVRGRRTGHGRARGRAANPAHDVRRSDHAARRPPGEADPGRREREVGEQREDERRRDRRDRPARPAGRRTRRPGSARASRGRRPRRAPSSARGRATAPPRRAPARRPASPAPRPRSCPRTWSERCRRSGRARSPRRWLPLRAPHRARAGGGITAPPRRRPSPPLSEPVGLAGGRIRAQRDLDLEPCAAGRALQRERASELLDPLRNPAEARSRVDRLRRGRCRRSRAGAGRRATTTRSSACDAAACFATFASASEQTRYAACSTAASKRRSSTASETATGELAASARQRARQTLASEDGRLEAASECRDAPPVPRPDSRRSTARRRPEPGSIPASAASIAASRAPRPRAAGVRAERAACRARARDDGVMLEARRAARGRPPAGARSRWSGGARARRPRPGRRPPGRRDRGEHDRPGGRNASRTRRPGPTANERPASLVDVAPLAAEADLERRVAEHPAQRVAHVAFFAELDDPVRHRRPPRRQRDDEHEPVTSRPAS